MSLVMTLLVRDEQDIIAENIEFHKSQGVDFFIVTDNKSIDDTPHILKEYQKSGVLQYIWEGKDNYNQHEWVSRMAQLAFTEYQADWVINNDADEFWWPIQGTLKTTFHNIPSEFNALSAERFNFVPLVNVHSPFYNDMIYRERVSLNPLGNPLPPKMAHRGYPNIIVEQGNHKVRGIGELNIISNLVEIFHFPIRTYEQFVNKIKTGGAAYERNEKLPESMGYTWRNLYDQYKQNNNLINYYQQHLYDQKRLNEQLRSGAILEDTRLSKYFLSNNLLHEY